MGSWRTAAIEALQLLGEESHVEDIFRVIRDRALYIWSTQTPTDSLTNEIRRSLEGFEHQQPCETKVFYQTEGGSGRYGLLEWNRVQRIPEEVGDDEEHSEGATKTIRVNAYERDPKARLECIKYYGAKCGVCEFTFASKYGELGDGFIHVHHLKPLSAIGEEYIVDPVEDLLPVCPNCHAMLHKMKPPLWIERLRAIIDGEDGDFQGAEIA